MFKLIQKPQVSQCILFHGNPVSRSYLPILSVYDYYAAEIPKCTHKKRSECQCQWAWLIGEISKSMAPFDIEQYQKSTVHGVMIEDLCPFGVPKHYLVQMIQDADKLTAGNLTVEPIETEKYLFQRGM